MPLAVDKGAFGRLFHICCRLISAIKKRPAVRGVLAISGYQAAKFLATNSQFTKVQKVSMYFGRRLRKSM